jgi:hypothetical protein
LRNACDVKRHQMIQYPVQAELVAAKQFTLRLLFAARAA